MVVLDHDGRLGEADLPMALQIQPPVDVATQGGGYALEGKSLEEVENDLIRVTLDAFHGNRQKAAARLGIGERTLYRKIKDLGE